MAVSTLYIYPKNYLSKIFPISDISLFVTKIVLNMKIYY